MSTPIRLQPPVGPAITIRFVLHAGMAGRAIAWHEGTVMPFAPGHVECILPDGRHVGMFAEVHDGAPAGMQVRHDGYDAGDVVMLADGRPCDLWVDLSCDQGEKDAFYAEALKAVGKPYDDGSILGYSPIPIRGHHKVGSLLCSSEQVRLLRVCGWFKHRLAMPFHEIDPAMLLLILSAMVEVPH